MNMFKKKVLTLFDAVPVVFSFILDFGLLMLVKAWSVSCWCWVANPVLAKGALCRCLLMADLASPAFASLIGVGSWPCVAVRCSHLTECSLVRCLVGGRNIFSGSNFNETLRRACSNTREYGRCSGSDLLWENEFLLRTKSGRKTP